MNVNNNTNLPVLLETKRYLPAVISKPPEEKHQELNLPSEKLDISFQSIPVQEKPQDPDLPPEEKLVSPEVRTEDKTKPEKDFSHTVRDGIMEGVQIKGNGVKNNVPTTLTIEMEEPELHKGHEKSNGHHEPLWVEASDISHLAGVALNNMAKAAKHANQNIHTGVVTEGLHGAAHGTSALLNVSTAAAGIGAVGLIANGIKELKEGHKVAGTSSLFAGVSSGSEAVAGVIHATGILGPTGAVIAEVAATGAAVLGGVHGAIDIARGAKEIYDGVKEKNKDKIINGSLMSAIGGALIVAVATGGVIPAVAAVAMVGAKAVYNNRQGLSGFGKKIADKTTNTWNKIFHKDIKPEDKKTE